MSRLPIFHDDHSFREQTERMFRAMEQNMPFNPAAGLPPLPHDDFMTAAAPWRAPSLNGGTFFQLRPSAGLQEMTSADMGRAGLPSEILDDDIARGLFVDVDPQKADGGRGRVFRMSFDARQYDPADVTVSCDAGCLVVEAKHVEQDPAGSKVVRQFQRRIQLPRAVEPGKLTSTLSTDGILTVEAPVPPCYQSVVGPAQNSDPMLMTASVPAARASPVSIRLDPGAGRSSSPFLDAVAGRRSPFTTSQRPVSGDINTGLRNSPVQFGSLAPITALTPSTSPRQSSVDVPLITTDPATGRRRLELLLELGQPYTADDVVVRVDGRRLTIDARRESRDQQGRVTTSTAQKQFDIGEQLDETSVQATMRDDGRMVITGHIIQ